MLTVCERITVFFFIFTKEKHKIKSNMKNTTNQLQTVGCNFEMEIKMSTEKKNVH